MEFVWLRQDLRVHDHEPLMQALESGTPVMAGYVFDRRLEERTEAGFPRQDDKRRRFLLESLLEMHQQLGRLGVPFVVADGDAAQEVQSWMQQFPVQRIHAHRLPGTEEADDEAGITAAADAAGVEVVWYHGDTLYHEDDLPFALSDMPATFNQFRKKVETSGVQPRPARGLPREQTPMYLEDHAYTGEDLMNRFSSIRAETFVNGGEQEGVRRLEEYLFRTGHVFSYKQRRNGMLEFDDSSKLSSWLASGCLSPRRVYEQLQELEEQEGANDSTYWLYFELLWRDYFHFLLKKEGARLFRRDGLQQLPVAWKQDSALFDAWCDGRTGYPLIDASMRQLKKVGYMSNRARQNTASFLTKNLGIDWRWGAAWFESHLIDYDPGSNYGNWQYIGGVGTDVKEFRAFHVVHQGERYDPDGAFVKYWIPELKHVPAEYIYQPAEMSEVDRNEGGLTLGETYPYPVVSLEQSLEEQKERFKQATKETDKEQSGK
ncbi:DASH family cryptochrome [Alkalicoccus chagannorensis]|uniref:DASH family cryptochrome n=1 Tax=Alkalicoccus chagannorensis TaxID=427072 RepID=UPI00047E208F|nr:DASH family cryptochrome [Alkalicoccus chagannorensis]